MSCEIQVPPAADPTTLVNTSHSNIRTGMNGNAPADSVSAISTPRSNIKRGSINVNDLQNGLTPMWARDAAHARVNVNDLHNGLTPMMADGKAAFGKTLESGIVVGASSNSISGTINGLGSR